jgi:hypothetical protein
MPGRESLFGRRRGQRLASSVSQGLWAVGPPSAGLARAKGYGPSRGQGRVTGGSQSGDCVATRIALTYELRRGGCGLKATSEHGRVPGGARLVPGALCLDFANTAAWHTSTSPEEQLRSYVGLMAWSRRAEPLMDPQAARLLHPAAAAAALR